MPKHPLVKQDAKQTPDRRALALLEDAMVETIPDVIEVMEGLSQILSAKDGIRIFNQVYLQVTKAVLADVEHGRWKSPEWMVLLDVEFAKLFFSALVAWFRDPSTTPPAWVPLFEHRFKARVLPVQFVLAGLNAHINRDLPIAIVRAFQRYKGKPQRKTPEADDFDRVNEVLNEVEMEQIQELATGWVKQLCDASTLAPKALMQVVGGARTGAWLNAKLYWSLLSREKAADVFVSGLDRLTEQMGRVLLIPTDRSSDVS